MLCSLTKHTYTHCELSWSGDRFPKGVGRALEHEQTPLAVKRETSATSAQERSGSHLAAQSWDERPSRLDQSSCGADGSSMSSAWTHPPSIFSRPGPSVTERARLIAGLGRAAVVVPAFCDGESWIGHSSGVMWSTARA